MRFSGDLYVSMAGGSILRFGADSGLNDEPLNNKISFKNTDIFNGNEITIMGPNMDGKYREARSSSLLPREIYKTDLTLLTVI